MPALLVSLTSLSCLRSFKDVSEIRGAIAKLRQEQRKLATALLNFPALSPRTRIAETSNAAAGDEASPACSDQSFLTESDLSI